MKNTLWAVILLFSSGSAPISAATIDVDRLMQHAQALSAAEMAGRRTGTPGSVLARNYIQSVFTQLDLKSYNEGYLHPFSFGAWLSEQQGVNLLGWVQGTSWPDVYIVISAHYDHLGSKGGKIFYGADDNASGVAALLMLAEAVSASPLHHSVVFLATDAEELGLYGAKAFADSPSVPLHTIRLNINLDMLGIGDRRNRLYIGGARDSLLRQAIAAIETTAPFQVVAGFPRQPRGFGSGRRINYRNASDHGVFARHNIDFVFITTGDHAYYHTEEDRFEQLNKGLMGQATQAIWSLLTHVDRTNRGAQK